MQGLSIVVPVYKGAQSIPELTAEFARFLPQIADAFEVIFVEDDGGDNSWDVIQDLAAQYAWVRGLKMSRNYGQHAALLFGIRAARYGITATMDDDLQHPPTELPKLLAKLDEGYDVVYGSPQNEQYAGVWRKMATRVTKFTLRNVGVKLAGDVSAFRVFRTELRDAFASYQSPFVSIDALLTWGTTRFALAPVLFGQRRYGQSNYTFGRLVGHTMNMMTGFSTVPLRLASLIGFAFTVFGLIMLVYVLGRLLLEESVPGFPFLASSIAIFSGAQLFTIGIIGEYLARMHIRAMGRPAGHVRRSVGFDEAAAGEPAPVGGNHHAAVEALTTNHRGTEIIEGS